MNFYKWLTFVKIAVVPLFQCQYTETTKYHNLVCLEQFTGNCVRAEEERKFIYLLITKGTREKKQKIIFKNNNKNETA